jgi:transcriptional regulator with XRE-family HTH domain
VLAAEAVRKASVGLRRRKPVTDGRQLVLDWMVEGDLSYAEAARKLGSTTMHLWRWMGSERGISLATARRWSRVTGIAVAQLLCPDCDDWTKPLR